MSNREDLTFNSLEQVLSCFPYFVTAELHTVKELTVQEAFMIQRAQARERKKQADFHTPRDGGAVDYLELRGRMLFANGGKTETKDTGVLYVNRSYVPSREQWHDFSDGDLVTYFFQSVSVIFDFYAMKQRAETRPVCIYNHETHVLTQCQDNFLNLGILDVSGHNPLPLMEHNQAWRASNAVEFLSQNNFIAQQGYNPRPINDQPTNFEWRNPPHNSGFSCLRVILLLFIVLGALWLGLAIFSSI